MTVLMFYVKYKMFILSKDLVAMDTKIEQLQKDKELLNIELTYLTSTERILDLIDKNPNILNNKDVIDTSQLKTKYDFTSLSLTKLKKQIYSDKKIAIK
jgi:cell division protein FtsL